MKRSRARIAGASLRLSSASVPLEVMTDADGAFRFQNLPHGDYSLEPGQRVTSLPELVAVSLPVGPVGSYLPQVVGIPGEPLGSPAASTISGRLVSRAGTPLADVLVSVGDIGRRREVEVAVLTDADGRYLAENLPAGTYSVRAELPAGLHTRRAACLLESHAQCTRNLVIKERPSRRR